MNEITAIQPNMKLVRQVMNLLDEHFDEKICRYKTGWGDEKVAKDVGIHVGQVAKIRADAYGELADDPIIMKLRDACAEHELKTEELAKEAKVLSARLEAYINSRKVSG